MNAHYSESDSHVFKAIASYRRFDRLLSERNKGRRMRHESLVRFDPFQGQGRILLQLNETSGITQARLADSLGITQQSLSTALQKMVATGLVSRERDPLDKRVRLIFLTDDGKAEVARLQERSKYSGSVFEALDEAEIEQLIELFDKLSLHLQNELNAAGDTVE